MGAEKLEDHHSFYQSRDLTHELICHSLKTDLVPDFNNVDILTRNIFDIILESAHNKGLIMFPVLWKYGPHQRPSGSALLASRLEWRVKSPVVIVDITVRRFP